MADEINDAVNKYVSNLESRFPDKGDVTDFFTGEAIPQNNSTQTSGNFQSTTSGTVSSSKANRTISGGGGSGGQLPPGGSRGPLKIPKGGRGIDAAFEIVFEELDEIKLELIEYIFPRVVTRTPVSTGRARKGWAVSGKSGGIPFVPMGEYPAYKGARPFIKPIPDGVHKTKQNIVIGNSVDYINDLNNGSSNQASAFFVDAVVGDAINHVGRFD